MEVSFGELGDVSLVQSKLPKKLKKRRPIATEDGPAGYVTNPLFICFVQLLFRLLFVFLIHSVDQIFIWQV